MPTSLQTGKSARLFRVGPVVRRLVTRPPALPWLKADSSGTLWRLGVCGGCCRAPGLIAVLPTASGQKGEIWPLWPPDSAGLAAASGISSGQIAAPLPDLATQRLLSGEGPR